MNQGDARARRCTRRHAEEHVNVHCVQECFDELLLKFHSVQSPPTNPHWSSVGAKPHLGTLPSLKQIRPQRLIKPSMSKASWMKGYQRGEPFSATPHSSHNELAQDRALLFSADKKCQPLCCLHHLKTLFLAAKWCYDVVLFPLLNGLAKRETLNWFSVRQQERANFPSLDQLPLSSHADCCSRLHTLERHEEGLGNGEKQGKSTCLKAEIGMATPQLYPGCVHCRQTSIYIFKKRKQAFA